MGFKIKNAVCRLRQLLCLQEAVHYGSISGAAEKNGMKQSNLSVQIKELEESLNEKLILRIHNGITLTEAGQEVYALSCHVSNALNKLDTAKIRACHVSGAIRFWTSDGLATAYISECFSQFYLLYPNVHIELICSLEMPRFDQFDMAVVYEKPTSVYLKIVAEHDLKFGLFASKKYLEQYGYPKNMQDLYKNHRLCSRINYTNVWPKWAEIMDQAEHVCAVTNSSGMLQRLVLDGIGIGLLPIGVSGQEAELVELTNLKTNFHHKFWLVVRDEVRHIDKINALVNFIGRVSARL